MTGVKINHFRIHKILLLALGVWPLQQSNFTRFQFIFLSSILTAHVIFQCTVFISQKCTTDLIIKVLSSVVFFTMFMIKYYMFYVNINGMKDLLERLLHVCNELKDENEIAIINKYGCYGVRYTISLLVAFCSISLVIFALFWPDVLNIILSINESRSHHLIIMTEYFIDQQKYFYFIFLHTIAALIIGATAMVAIGTMFITYLQLVCGMFKIASYRIKRAMSNNILQNMNQLKYIFIYKGLICAVNIHRQAMNLSTVLMFNIETMMLCLTISAVLSVSFNLFRVNLSELFQVMSFKENVEELLLPFLFTCSPILYMFLANYNGQIVTNYNEHIFITVYNVKWYIAPLCIQKMVLFLLQRSSKNFNLNVGGLFNGSLENFATLIKASVSYFTVIYSTQG
ncbi:Odorant receptor 305 [Nylanderia fulva]|uniref:Odorant receptor n=1 Tax=Nylanderia fulva TaxID=613905 RepID=A0A6G1LQ15_9HYME|nr:Odorant receptor 305 [Nylanderia fulva]